MKLLLPFFRPFTLPLLLGFFLCLWGGAGSASGQEPRVRAHLETTGTVWVGQQVTVVVEVLAPGYFSSAVSFDFPDPQGVLLMPPLGSPVVSSETVGNLSYTVQRYELSAFPMRAGRQAIPAMALRFSYQGGPAGTSEIPAALTTAPLPFTVKPPPGTEKLGQVISARNLKLTETWRPVPGKTGVAAGAAFVRTVTFTAPDLPGMAFPPFPAGRIDGLGIYTKHQMLDKAERGELSGGRRDVITYVCQRPGEFTIPAVRFSWFDLETNRLVTNDLPARTLQVLANPALAAAGPAAATQGVAPRSMAVWALAAVATLFLLGVCASRRVGLCRLLATLFKPLHAVHLQPLNPTGQIQGKR